MANIPLDDAMNIIDTIEGVLADYEIGIAASNETIDPDANPAPKLERFIASFKEFSSSKEPDVNELQRIVQNAEDAQRLLKSYNDGTAMLDLTNAGFERLREIEPLLKQLIDLLQR